MRAVRSKQEGALWSNGRRWVDRYKVAEIGFCNPKCTRPHDSRPSCGAKIFMPYCTALEEIRRVVQGCAPAVLASGPIVV